MRELIPGEDDQSVYLIFFLLTQSGNGGEQGTLLGVLYRRRSTSVVWRRAWQRRKIGGDTSADGEGCVRDTADDRADLALSKASCNCWDQLRTRGFPARASVRGRRVLAIPGKKRR